MIEEILKELMTSQCKMMQVEKSRCFKKGRCDGQCPIFCEALIQIESKKEED